MKTKEVRVDVELNKQLWAKGIRNVRPGRPAAPHAARGPLSITRLTHTLHPRPVCLCVSRCPAACAFASAASATTTRTPRCVAGLDLVAAAGVCLLLPPPLWLTLLSAPPPAQEEFVSVVEFVDVQGVFHDLGTKKVA